MNTGRYTGYFDTTLVDMSAERYVTYLIRLHQSSGAVVRCREMFSGRVGMVDAASCMRWCKRRGKDGVHEP